MGIYDNYLTAKNRMGFSPVQAVAGNYEVTPPPPPSGSTVIPAGSLATQTGPGSIGWGANPGNNPTSVPNQDPWVNPLAGTYEGDGGDPRAPGNHSGIGDWKTAVNRVLGPGDPVALIQAEMMRDAPSNTFGGVSLGQGINMANLNALWSKLTAAGLDRYTGGKIMEAFGSSGSSAHDAAYQLGVYQQYKAGGQNGLRPQGQGQHNQSLNGYTDFGNPNGENQFYTGQATPGWNAFGTSAVQPSTPPTHTQPPGGTPRNTTPSSPFVVDDPSKPASYIPKTTTEEPLSSPATITKRYQYKWPKRVANWSFE
jgi:hypothetical protein